MIILFILIRTNKFNKIGEAQLEQKDKSLKSIMKLRVNSILAIIFVLILVSILGYILLFLLELFKSIMKF